MIIELGHFALILAWGLSTVFLFSFNQNVQTFFRASIGIGLSILAAFLILLYAGIVSDYSLKLVVENTHHLNPLIYKICGMWGNHEGSMLLWVLVMALYYVVWSGHANRHLPEEAWVQKSLWVFNLMLFLFLSFTLFLANPFERLYPPPLNGADLNPSLQDPALSFHPPILYLGYIGFMVVFAQAFGLLMVYRIEEISKDQLSILKTYTFIPWGLLTLGVGFGSWWAYYELGWGGWWFWDPVENASLLPWLAGLMLLHAYHYPNRNIIFFLCFLAFSLSLLGTFIVRSGLITSVHSFAQDQARGVSLLIIFLLLAGSATALLAYRQSQNKTASPKPSYPFFGHKIGVKLHLIGFFLILAIIFLATFSSLLFQWFNLPQASIHNDFYALTLLPIFVPLLIYLAIITVKDIQKVRTYPHMFRKYLPMFLAHFATFLFFVGSLSATYLKAETNLTLPHKTFVTYNNHKFYFTDVTQNHIDNFLQEQAEIHIYKNNNHKTTLSLAKRFYPFRQLQTTEIGIYATFFKDYYFVLDEITPKEIRVQLTTIPLQNLIWLSVLLITISGFLPIILKRLPAK